METNVSSIYLLPGMVAKIKAPLLFKGKGDREILGRDGQYVTVTLDNGFAVENSDVGEIEIIADEPAVFYYHHKYDLNKVYFFAATGEQLILDIISVPIHDHSSIVTGGPAYGTYFTDDEVIGE